MEFIKNLYRSDYFLYILIGIIAVLIILFLVVLFSGKKKKKLEEESFKTVGMEGQVNSEPTVIAETPNVTPNETVVTNNLEETKEFDPSMIAGYQNNEFLSTNTPIVNDPTPVVNETVADTPIIMDTPVIEPMAMPQVEEPIIPEPIVSETPVVEPVVEEPTFNPFPDVTENTTKMPNVNQFSSVFIDNGNPSVTLEETNVLPIVNEPVVEEPVFPTPIEEPVIEPTPVDVTPVVEPIVETPKEEKLFSIVDDNPNELPKLNDQN